MDVRQDHETRIQSVVESHPETPSIATMKTTIDIPEAELREAMKFTNARTRREAVVGALVDYNRRMRLAALARYAGTCTDLTSPGELQGLRRQE